MNIAGMFLGIVCLSAFVFVLKKSQLHGSNVFAFTAVLYLTGFFISAATILFGQRSPDLPSAAAMPSTVAALALGAGIASVGGFLLHLQAIRVGAKLSLLTIIGNLSILIPIGYSMLFFQEKMSPMKWGGIFLFVVFAFLLRYAGKERAR